LETLQRTSSPSSEQQVEVTTTVQTPLWSLQMALKQHRALPGSTDEPSEPTLEQHNATSPPPRSPSFRTPAAPHTVVAPDGAQATPRPSRVNEWTVRAHPRAHHATSPPPRSPRRAATPLTLERTLQRYAPPPPRDASIGRPRVNHTRVYLVHDCLPHEAGPAAPHTVVSHA